MKVVNPSIYALAKLEANPPNVAPGGTSDVYIPVNGIGSVDDTTLCTPITMHLQAKRVSDGAITATYSLTEPGSMKVTTTETTDYVMTASCTNSPWVQSAPVSARVTVNTSPPPGPVSVSALSPSSTYVNIDETVTLTWSASLPSCKKGEVRIVGMGQDYPGQVFEWHTGASGSVSGSVNATVTQWTRYTLSAVCHDNNSSASSSAVGVQVYNPQPTGSYSLFCFMANCTYSGCTTQSVPTTDASAAQAAIDAIYPASSGCTADPIDCSDMASACAE
jgi:hypothetical protein